jgi:hypothetical protein
VIKTEAGAQRQPLQMLCPECNWDRRDRCDECGGAGMFDVDGCPGRWESPDVSLALMAQRRSDAGSWPVAGGWLDQTQKCLDAIDFIRQEMLEWELRKLKGD